MLQRSLSGLTTFILWSTTAASQNLYQSTLPSQETQNALESIEVQGDLNPTNVSPGDLLSFSNEGTEASTSSTAGTEEGYLPFIVPNSLVVRVDPNLTEDGLHELIEDYDWEVLQTFPRLGQMHVRANLEEYFRIDGIEALDPNMALVEGVLATNRALINDPRISTATPDYVISTQQVSGLSSGLPYPMVESHADPSIMISEQNDWGIEDIGADKIWSLPGAMDGAVLGVLDVGFHRHEDISYWGFVDLPIADHGNHVAGIACARHNGVGVAGVIPNCLVAPRSGNFFPVIDEGGNILQFMTTFSQLVDTLDDKLDDDDGIVVFNLSLGYNWIPNFGINPDDPDNGLYRQLVAMQGESLTSALELASENGIIIVSAAGNDSSSLPAPMNAKFASPFNWAAFTTRERGSSYSGLVIEAHDSAGSRASFSNVGGDLSCPGVDILSTVSFDGSGQASESEYGYMSGTSMAAPYCAAGVMLFRLIRPNLTAEEVVDCITSTAVSSSSGAPHMKLDLAADFCASE